MAKLTKGRRRALCKAGKALKKKAKKSLRKAGAALVKKFC